MTEHSWKCLVCGTENPVSISNCSLCDCPSTTHGVALDARRQSYLHLKSSTLSAQRKPTSETLNILERLPINLWLLVLSLLVALWICFATFYLFWVSPVAYLASLAIGWKLGCVARGTAASSFLATFAIPTVVAIGLLGWLPPDPAFGNLFAYFLIAHLIAIFIPFTVFRYKQSSSMNHLLGFIALLLSAIAIFMLLFGS